MKVMEVKKVGNEKWTHVYAGIYAGQCDICKKSGIGWYWIKGEGVEAYSGDGCHCDTCQASHEDLVRYQRENPASQDSKSSNFEHEVYSITEDEVKALVEKNISNEFIADRFKKLESWVEAVLGECFGWLHDVCEEPEEYIAQRAKESPTFMEYVQNCSCQWQVPESFNPKTGKTTVLIEPGKYIDWVIEIVTEREWVEECA